VPRRLPAGSRYTSSSVACGRRSAPALTLGKSLAPVSSGRPAKVAERDLEAASTLPSQPLALSRGDVSASADRTPAAWEKSLCKGSAAATAPKRAVAAAPFFAALSMPQRCEALFVNLLLMERVTPLLKTLRRVGLAVLSCHLQPFSGFRAGQASQVQAIIDGTCGNP